MLVHQHIHRVWVFNRKKLKKFSYNKRILFLLIFIFILDISLRGLLNTQNQQNQGQPGPHLGGFNGPPNFGNMQTPGGPVPGGGGGVPSQQVVPSQAHSQMRQHFLGGPPQHQNFGQGQPPQNNANFMAANGPRYQNFTRMQQTHPSGMGGGGQPGGPGSVGMRPMMQSVSFKNFN